MTELKFTVGEVVMFFVENGELVAPPSHEEVTEEFLDRGTWGSVVRADSDAVVIETDEGKRIVTKSDFDKIWFSNERTHRSAHPAGSLFTGHSLHVVPEDLLNIRPVAEA